MRDRIRADASGERLIKMCAGESGTGPILTAMARSGVWFTPTLATWRAVSLSPAALARLPGTELVPPALERQWGDPEPPNPVEVELLSAMGPLTASAHGAGVALLAGTDSGDPHVVPGFALHDELQLMVEAGVPPLQALRSATLEPARALGVASEVGSIERGKAADIVLLQADPLADIRNTRRIAAVVLKGQLMNAEQLTALLAPLRRTK